MIWKQGHVIVCVYTLLAQGDTPGLWMIIHKFDTERGEQKIHMIGQDISPFRFITLPKDTYHLNFATGSWERDIMDLYMGFEAESVCFQKCLNNDKDEFGPLIRTLLTKNFLHIDNIKLALKQQNNIHAQKMVKRMGEVVNEYVENRPKCEYNDLMQSNYDRIDAAIVDGGEIKVTTTEFVINVEVREHMDKDDEEGQAVAHENIRIISVGGKTIVIFIVIPDYIIKTRIIYGENTKQAGQPIKFEMQLHSDNGWEEDETDEHGHFTPGIQKIPNLAVREDVEFDIPLVKTEGEGPDSIHLHTDMSGIYVRSIVEIRFCLEADGFETVPDVCQKGYFCT